MGDDIQAIKAGILEIGDVFTINKCDRDGADRLNVEIEMMLDLNSEEVDWRPPIKRTIASRDEGVADVIEAMEEHREFLEESGLLQERRHERTVNEIIAMVKEHISRHVMEKITSSGEFDNYVEQVYARKVDPYTVVESIVGNAIK